MACKYMELCVRLNIPVMEESMKLEYPDDEVSKEEKGTIGSTILIHLYNTLAQMK